MKSISYAAALLLVSGLGVAACGVFSSAESEGTSEPPARVDADVDAGPTPDAASAVDAAPDAPPTDAAPPLLCDVAVQKSESFGAEADGLLAVSSTQLFGALSVCNTGVGRCLARFSLSAAARTALGATNKVVSMTLALQRAETDANCGGSCASLRQAGLLTVVPARVDWVESQMNWDVLKTSSNWGVAGAGQVGTDIGDVAGSLSILATDLAPKVSLDPTKWTPTFLPTSQVAVRYELLDGANRRQFVSVSHEVGALPHEPPKLTLTYCP